MEIPLYLAMTAAEFQASADLPCPLAWMACHFSSYGTGLSNIPGTLPAGSMLMLNDRTPLCGHNPQLVAKTLCEAAKVLECDRIVLDFQREDCPEILGMVQAVLAQASCPVGVSSLYGKDLTCPVLVPPILPYVSEKEALAPWEGREIWLELSSSGTEICVTEQGSQYTPLLYPSFDGVVHCEPKLHCHYTITVKEDRVLFHLGRTKEDQVSLLESARELGVSCALGLWQEMKTGKR